jgi:hypothetical protein
MQRWIKLPDGRFIDAGSIIYISKTETFARFDEDGNDLGTGYSVNIGTGVLREEQITVTGSKEEVFTVLRSILGQNTTPPAAN